MPGKIDWRLLIFLLLFLNVKLLVKVAAILLIYILRNDFKFGFRLRNSRLPLFYLLIIGIALFNWLFYGLIGNTKYNLVLFTGILFWVLCILAAQQVKLSVEKNDTGTIHRTIVVFFIINAVVSLAVYAGIIAETGHINPYTYQGDYQKYFIGTGDYIKGLTFDTSTTNAVLNSFAVIYFLSKGKNMMVILCMAVMLLTGSNVANLLLSGTMLFLFFFQSNRDQKSIIIVCLVMLVTFLVKVSPQNNEHLLNVCQGLLHIRTAPKRSVDNIPITARPDSVLTAEEKKQKTAQLYMDSVNLSQYEKDLKKSQVTMAPMAIPGFIAKPILPKDSIHTPKFQHKNDTNALKKDLITYVAKHPDAVPLSSRMDSMPGLPGKLMALQQTGRYFRQHPGKLLTGTGTGNFSSKLAFRATAMKLTGGYPASLAYISNDFRSNHLDLYLYFFTNKDDYHSIVNTPNSTYDQLLSEYGLAGLISFVGFYMAFFLKQLRKRSYAIPLFLFMTGAFFIDYWFEQLSVVVFFELLVWLNIKEESNKKINEAA
ncbi:MAG: hypothetical protein IPP96_16520 [Chitinophagaceae bacterium]|nr:hypothetical protein [Chitinophagaceae bacterium]